MHLFTLATWDGLTVNPALIVNTPGLLRESVASLHRAAQVRRKPAPPLLANPGTAVFGAGNEMAVKAEVRRWHASVPRPSRAHHVFGSVSRWLRRKAALPPANFPGSSRAPKSARTCTTAKYCPVPGVGRRQSRQFGRGSPFQPCRSRRTLPGMRRCGRDPAADIRRAYPTATSSGVMKISPLNRQVPAVLRENGFSEVRRRGSPHRHAAAAPAIYCDRGRSRSWPDSDRHFELIIRQSGLDRRLFKEP